MLYRITSDEMKDRLRNLQDIFAASSILTAGTLVVALLTVTSLRISDSYNYTSTSKAAARVELWNNTLAAVAGSEDGTTAGAAELAGVLSAYVETTGETFDVPATLSPTGEIDPLEAITISKPEASRLFGDSYQAGMSHSITETDGRLSDEFITAYRAAEDGKFIAETLPDVDSKNPTGWMWVIIPSWVIGTLAAALLFGVAENRRCFAVRAPGRKLVFAAIAPGTAVISAFELARGVYGRARDRRRIGGDISRMIDQANTIARTATSPAIRAKAEQLAADLAQEASAGPATAALTQLETQLAERQERRALVAEAYDELGQIG